jgi:hypothetical protein
MLAVLRGAPVLTISDIDSFATLGGIAQFFVEGGKIRFGINLDAVRRSRLQLSSKLLALAELLGDRSPQPSQGDGSGPAAVDEAPGALIAALAPASSRRTRKFLESTARHERTIQ